MTKRRSEAVLLLGGGGYRMAVDAGQRMGFRVPSDLKLVRATIRPRLSEASNEFVAVHAHLVTGNKVVFSAFSRTPPAGAYKQKVKPEFHMPHEQVPDHETWTDEDAFVYAMTEYHEDIRPVASKTIFFEFETRTGEPVSFGV